MDKKKGLWLASTAAALFLSGGLAQAADATDASNSTPMNKQGCNGKSGCSGKNGCKSKNARCASILWFAAAGASLNFVRRPKIDRLCAFEM